MYRSGGICSITGAVKNAQQFAPGYKDMVFARLPVGFAPAQNCYFICQGSAMNRWMLAVSTGGTLSCTRYGTSQTADVGAGSWFVLSGTWAVG